MLGSMLFSPTLPQALLMFVLGYIFSVIVYKLVFKNEGLATLSFQDIFIILLPGSLLGFTQTFFIKEANPVVSSYISLMLLVLSFFVFHWMLKKYLPMVSIQKSFKIYAIATAVGSIIMFVVAGLLIAGNWDSFKEIAQNQSSTTQDELDPAWVMKNGWWIVLLSIASIFGLILFNRRVSSKMTSTVSQPVRIIKYVFYTLLILVGLLFSLIFGYILLNKEKFSEPQAFTYTIPQSAISDIPGSIDLASYITEELGRGVIKEDIRKVLIDNGWQVEYVERALNAVIKQDK